MSIDNRTVAIIGGSSGIGLEVARQVIAQGGRVFIGARDVQRLERAVQVLGPAASGYRVDSADEASVQAFFEAAPALDHLFTPGASYQLGKFVELDEAQARTPLDMKFWGQYRAIRHALPKLREGGSVVLMAGALGARVGMVGAAYAACNAAIETRAVRWRWSWRHCVSTPFRLEPSTAIYGANGQRSSAVRPSTVMRRARRWVAWARWGRSPTLCCF